MTRFLAQVTSRLGSVYKTIAQLKSSSFRSLGFRLRAESNSAAHEFKVLGIWFRIQILVSVQKIITLRSSLGFMVQGLGSVYKTIAQLKGSSFRSLGFRLRAESNSAAHEFKVLGIWFRIQILVSVQKIITLRSSLGFMVQGLGSVQKAKALRTGEG